MKKPPLSLLLLPTVLFADDVYIKGAGSISGRIMDQTATQVVVDIGGGTVGIPMARVDRIVMAPTVLDEYDARSGRLAPRDIDGWRELGRWASLQGLDKQARQAYERILAITPDDPEAEDALGFVLLEGRWVPEEVAYRAGGFVKFQGEWLLPAEAQLRLDAVAAERAERDAAESARTAELEKLKAEVKAQYDAEAAADAEWRAEGAAWFYAHASGWGEWGCVTMPWPASPCSHGRLRHGR